MTTHKYKFPSGEYMYHFTFYQVLISFFVICYYCRPFMVGFAVLFSATLLRLKLDSLAFQGLGVLKTLAIDQFLVKSLKDKLC